MRLSSILVVASIMTSSFVVAGCGGDEEGLGTCPTDSAAAEAQGQKIIEAQCLSCHSSQVSGSARQGAPDSLNFDSLDTVRGEAGEMYEEVVDGSMPPAAPITGADLENVRVWLACGAKDTTP